MSRYRFVLHMLAISGAISVMAPVWAGNLMIEVRIESYSAADQQGMGAGVHGGHWGGQGGQRTVTRRESNVQRLMVMDGGTATLSSAQTQPLRLRQVMLGPYGKVISEGYVYRSLGGGIRVTPRSRGDMVMLELSAEEARPVSGHQASEVMQLSTQISGRMGDWILLADEQRSSSGEEGRGGGGYALAAMPALAQAAAIRAADRMSGCG